jgi:hypothetical protein
VAAKSSARRDVRSVRGRVSGQTHRPSPADLRSGSPRGRRGAPGVLGDVSIVTGTSALAYVHAPWWVVLAMTFAALLARVVQATVPQKSKHRLAWWRERRNLTARRRLAEPPIGGRRRRLREGGRGSSC